MLLPAELQMETLPLAGFLWWYFFSKWLELLDTVFMIIKGRLNQVSLLHVYHHVTMPLFWWIGMNWVPLGDAYYGAMVNSFVHVVMYLYYALCSIGIHPWWKRYLTQLQMIQFVGNMIHSCSALYLECGYIPWMHKGLIGYMLSFLALFGQFYFFAYKTSAATKKESKTA
eukprot:TRINITY_DN2904_c0_g1_i38.p3 TRINITY_DN2904_c0_g1~~TRINITY_DN2904_c0_g1_i38.p3  ORF type:complete len:170 (+),score=45.14 TRINITY_DN2904_c0_g1_i38:751-1260(+)